MCRKAHGAAFGTYYSVDADAFQWTTPVDSIASYRSSPEIVRPFCAHCGSVVPVADESTGHILIPAGCHRHGPPVTAHIFVASRAPWHEIDDDLPQHAEFDPESPGNVYAASEMPTKPADVVARGSCLCGAVAFDVVEPFKVIYNCHCSRCRSARAAAFTTNGFTSDQGVRFTRGEEHVRHFKLPQAKYFTHAFCDTCGSGMPRIDSGRKVAVVPLGALDDDPEQGPVSHIHTADKADWYQIGSKLQQFEQGPS